MSFRHSILHATSSRAIALTVGVPHLSQKGHLGRREGEILREGHGRSEEASLVERVGGPEDGELPLVDVVVIYEPCGEPIDGVLPQRLQLSIELERGRGCHLS